MAQPPAGCLGTIFRLFGFGRVQPPSAEAFPQVRVNKFFVSPAEADFFRVLQRVVGSRGHVLAQVSLRQLVWFPGNGRSNPGRQSWQNRVAGKSIDFVVCDPATLAPRVAIELDEPSHARPDRQSRDDQVEAVLRAAGLPCLRVLTSRTYDTRELEYAIAPHLRPN